jgi:hypothetical protein
VERLEPTAKRFMEAARQIGDGLLAWEFLSILTFARAGWSEAPLKSMELAEFTQLVDRLADKPDEVVKRVLDVEIPAYFRRDDHAPLSEMVASWKPRFEDRHHVFEDALWAHKLGYYTLSIPALAGQFEGIVRDRVQEYGRGSKWMRSFLQALSYDYDNPPGPTKAEEVPQFMQLPAPERFRSAEELTRYFTLCRLEELFEDRDFSKPGVSSVVNRHVIAHGVFRSFGEEESLRLFFVLDLLHKAIGMYDGLARSTADRPFKLPPTRRDDEQ